MSADTHPSDRGHLEVLDTSECWRLLASVPVGRIAVIDAGDPVVFPVNHAVDGTSVVFATTFGTKLNAADRDTGVVFEADDYDAEGRIGWSVIVKGRAESVLDEDEIERLATTAGHLTWADGVERDRWIRVVANEITGRRIARE